MAAAAVRLLAGAARRRPALGRRLLATGPAVAAGEYDVAVVGGGIVGAAVARVSAGQRSGRVGAQPPGSRAACRTPAGPRGVLGPWPPSHP